MRTGGDLNRHWSDSVSTSVDGRSELSFGLMARSIITKDCVHQSRSTQDALWKSAILIAGVAHVIPGWRENHDSWVSGAGRQLS